MRVVAFLFCCLRSACESTVTSVEGRGCGASDFVSSSSALLSSEELSESNDSTFLLRYLLVPSRFLGGIIGYSIIS